MIGREKNPNQSEVARLIQQSIEQDKRRAEARRREVEERAHRDQDELLQQLDDSEVSAGVGRVWEARRREVEEERVWGGGGEGERAGERREGGDRDQDELLVMRGRWGQGEGVGWRAGCTEIGS